jgi:hypothetical protein
MPVAFNSFKGYDQTLNEMIALDTVIDLAPPPRIGSDMYRIEAQRKTWKALVNLANEWVGLDPKKHRRL